MLGNLCRLSELCRLRYFGESMLYSQYFNTNTQFGGTYLSMGELGNPVIVFFEFFTS